LGENPPLFDRLQKFQIAKKNPTPKVANPPKRENKPPVRTIKLKCSQAITVVIASFFLRRITTGKAGGLLGAPQRRRQNREPPKAATLFASPFVKVGNKGATFTGTA
jgi:hypothetical protein